MARADIVTLIPLDRVATLLQIDPLHFNGVVSELRPLRNACDDIWFQHDYQWSGRVAREALAAALYQAEQMVTTYLGYPPLPKWFAAEEHRIDPPLLPESVSLGSRNVRGLRKSVRSRWGYIIEAGVRAISAIQLADSVVYSDADGDNYKETATVVTPTSLTDPDEISIFYPSHNGEARWEIRPTTVSISGGNATITFRREQAVIESQLEKLNKIEDGPPSINGDDDANFLTTVDVYRVYNDPSQQGTFYTEDTCGSCGGSGCEVCGLTAETACLLIRDARLGILAYDRADWNATTLQYDSASFSAGREPDKIKIWYRAGWRDETQTRPNKQMDVLWERLIVYYAFTLLDTEVSSCENTKRIISHMRTDLAVEQKDGPSYKLAEEDIRSPFGTTRAGIQLWRQIRNTLRGQIATAR